MVTVLRSRRPRPPRPAQPSPNAKNDTKMHCRDSGAPGHGTTLKDGLPKAVDPPSVTGLSSVIAPAPVGLVAPRCPLTLQAGTARAAKPTRLSVAYCVALLHHKGSRPASRVALPDIANAAHLLERSAHPVAGRYPADLSFFDVGPKEQRAVPYRVYSLRVVVVEANFCIHHEQATTLHQRCAVNAWRALQRTARAEREWRDEAVEVAASSRSPSE